MKEHALSMTDKVMMDKITSDCYTFVRTKIRFPISLEVSARKTHLEPTLN